MKDMIEGKVGYEAFHKSIRIIGRFLNMFDDGKIIYIGIDDSSHIPFMITGGPCRKIDYFCYGEDEDTDTLHITAHES